MRMESKTLTWLLLLIFMLHVAYTFDPNCTFAKKNLKYAGCPANMKVNWWDLAPYVYLQKSGEVNGTLKSIIEKMVKKCCGDCVEFTYSVAALNSEDLKVQIGSNGSVLNFPVYGTVVTEKFQDYPYFPVIESPGIIYIEGKTDTGSSAQAVMDAVFVAWPVIVLTVIMALLSGIIMWGLDSYWNPEEFPHSFVKGSWEGFWWAFVSMTTVGYGDKAPKSGIARVFAFFWVLIGLVIISIFTGTCTSALTALSLSNDINLFGKSIVALNHTEEKRYGVRGNAKVIPVASIDEFISKITNEPASGDTKPEGGLIDSYVAGYFKGKFGEETGLRVGKIFEHQFAYGFVLSNSLADTDISTCLRRTLSDDERYIVDKIQRTMQALPEPEKSAAEEKSSNMFDPTSAIFKTTVYTCLGIIAFLIICGVLWEYVYWRPKVAKKIQEETYETRNMTPHTTFEDLVGAQCQEIEDAMIGSVMDFYKEFNEKMEDVRKLHLRDEKVSFENDQSQIFLQDDDNLIK